MATCPSPESVEPALIGSTPFSELYFVQDRKYKTPKVEFHSIVYMNHSDFILDPKGYHSIFIFKYGLENFLKIFLYKAQCANITLSASPHPNGMKVHIKGFSDKLDVFVKEFGEKLIEYTEIFKNLEGETDPEAKAKKLAKLKGEYALFKNKRMESIDAKAKKAPFQQHFHAYNDAIYPGLLNFEVLKTELENLTFEDYVRCHNLMFSEALVESFIEGNLTEKEAISMEQSLYAGLKKVGKMRPMAVKDCAYTRNICLEPKKQVIYKFKVLNDEEKSNVCSVIFNMPQGLEYRNLNRFTEQFVHTDFYKELRTVQQLGYVVFSYNHKINNSSTMTFLVQSEKLLSSDIALRIYDFLHTYRGKIDELTDERFETIREGILAKLRQEHNSMTAEAGFLFSKIQDHSFKYGDREECIAEIEGFTKEQFVEHYKNLIFEQQRIIEIHMGSSENMDKNDELLRKRKEESGKSENGFLNLGMEVYEDEKMLQRDHLLYKDQECKRVKRDL